MMPLVLFVITDRQPSVNPQVFDHLYNDVASSASAPGPSAPAAINQLQQQQQSNFKHQQEEGGDVLGEHPLQKQHLHQ